MAETLEQMFDRIIMEDGRHPVLFERMQRGEITEATFEAEESVIMDEVAVRAHNEYFHSPYALLAEQYKDVAYSPVRCPVCGAKMATHAQDHLCRMHLNAAGQCNVCGATKTVPLIDSEKEKEADGLSRALGLKADVE